MYPDFAFFEGSFFKLFFESRGNLFEPDMPQPAVVNADVKHGHVAVLIAAASGCGK